MSNIKFNDNPQTLFSQAPQPEVRRQTNSNVAPDGTQLPNAQLWLNIGYYVEVPSKEDPTVMEKRLVSLPMGIPLDNMKYLNVNTNSPEVNNIREAQNELLTAILNKAQGELNAGETLVLNNLTIEVRRVQDKQGPTDDNPYKANMPTF